MPELDHLYVIVRSDIPHPFLTVQVAHAAMAAINTFGFTPGKPHPNLVVCAVADEAELVAVFNRLKDRGVPCCAWYEFDLGNTLTAVATAPLLGEARRPLRRLKLLSAS